MRRETEKSFERTGIRPLICSALYPILIKLMMVCSFEKTTMFKVAFQSSTGETTNDFLKEFAFREKAWNQAFANGLCWSRQRTKNRVSNIFKIANEGHFRLFYIIPNSPFLNFIENIFSMIKLRITQHRLAKGWKDN